MTAPLSSQRPLPLAESSVTRIGADHRPDGDGVLVGWVDAAKRGEREAFGQIYDRFQLAVYRYALVRVRMAADAEDVTAETFVAAFRTIGRYTWTGLPFEAWLFRIARSKIVDHQRRLARRPAVSDLDAIDPALLPQAADVASVVVGREASAALFAAIGRLSADQQDVLALRFFGGLSVAETADAMGRSPDAVKQLQFRAVGGLRERLERQP